MLFGRPRTATRGRNRILRGKPRKGQNLENVDFLLIFTVYFVMSDFLGKSKSEATACARRLQKRMGIVPQRTQQFTRNLQNPVKI